MLPNRSLSLRADVMILLSALLWGGEYVVVKDMVGYIPPNWVNAGRFIIASLIMIPIFYRKIRTIDFKVLRIGILLGFFMFGGFTLQTIGIQYTTAGKSGFLTSTYVVIVPFVYWIIRKKFPGIKAIISAVICITGISLISLEGDFSLNPGDMLTVGSAFAFTGSIIGFDYYCKKYDAIHLTFLEMFSGGLMSLVLALAGGKMPQPAAWGGFEIFQIVYLIVLGSLVCHLLANVAMKWAESSHASILWSTESVFALVFGIIFLKERMSLHLAAGFILVFSAVLISELGPGKSSGVDKIHTL